MFGIALIIVGTILDEISSSIGKWEISHRKESVYTYGFLNYFWILIIFIVLCLVKGNFIFDTAAIPLFIILAILEILQTYSSLHATVEADRSTFGFLMTGTIPLLLIVDSLLGYKITLFGLIGIVIIVFTLIMLFINHGLSKKGLGYVLFSTINAVASISIYKYLITNHNSVEAQQILTCAILLVFLFLMAKFKSKENPFGYIFKKEFFVQSFSRGIGGVFVSLAYLYAPASVITSAKRGTSVLASIISGNRFFREKRLAIKIISFLLIIVGLILLVL